MSRERKTKGAGRERERSRERKRKEQGEKEKGAGSERERSRERKRKEKEDKKRCLEHTVFVHEVVEQSNSLLKFLLLLLHFFLPLSIPHLQAHLKHTP